MLASVPACVSVEQGDDLRQQRRIADRQDPPPVAIRSQPVTGPVGDPAAGALDHRHQRRPIPELQAANIKGTLENVFLSRQSLFEKSAANNDKYMKSFSLRYGSSMDIYNDLDRIMCVPDATDFDNCHTAGRWRASFGILGHHVGSPFDNQTESRYFDIRFFKKGTVHLTFKDERGGWLRRDSVSP